MLSQKTISKKCAEMCRRNYCIFSRNDREKEECPLHADWCSKRYWPTEDEWNHIYNFSNPKEKAFYRDAIKNIM